MISLAFMVVSFEKLVQILGIKKKESELKTTYTVLFIIH